MPSGSQLPLRDLLHCDHGLRAVWVGGRPLLGVLFNRRCGNGKVYVGGSACGLLQEVLITVAGEDQLAGSILDALIGCHEHRYGVTLLNVANRNQPRNFVRDAVLPGGKLKRSCGEGERDLTLDLTRLGRSQACGAKGRSCYQRECN